MRLKCDGIYLSDALSKVGKALPVRKTQPILNGIKLVAKGNELTMTATDLDLSVETTISADVQIEGEAVVTGKYFIEYAKKIEGEEIVLDTTVGNLLRLTYGENQGNVQTMEADEYPQSRQVGDEFSFFIMQKELKSLIEKVIFAAANEDNRPVLKGCFLELSHNKIVAVTSDGYRLAYNKKEIAYGGESVKVIVPARSLSEISKLLESEGEEYVRVNIEKNYFMVDLKHTKVVTRLIEGDYINYEKIIPTQFTTEVVVERRAIDRAIDRASLAARAEKKSIIKLEIKENRMQISAESDISAINENIAVNLKGKDLSIGFNSRYLTESLRAVEDEFVKMNFTTSTAPSTIVPTDGDEYLYLILPVRIVG